MLSTIMIAQHFFNMCRKNCLSCLLLSSGLATLLESFVQFSPSFLYFWCTASGPLGPLLFSLVVLELIDYVGLLYFQFFSFKYGTWMTFMLQQWQQHGPGFGLHLNFEKCEVFCLSSDQSFWNLSSELQRVQHSSHLLGSPVIGSVGFLQNGLGKMCWSGSHSSSSG